MPNRSIFRNILHLLWNGPAWTLIALARLYQWSIGPVLGPLPFRAELQRLFCGIGAEVRSNSRGVARACGASADAIPGTPAATIRRKRSHGVALHV